ncbi:MAG: hypothetical protein HZB37_08700 [Planctomycetes bacterium]|nr:hypothetical protein [Planctomycetota bacterium]
MDKEIGRKITQVIKKFNDSFKKLSIWLIGIVISSWMIVGAVSLGVVIPALLVKTIVCSGWQKEAQAGIEKERPRSLADWQSRASGQGQSRNQAPMVRRSYIQSEANQPRFGLRDGLRETGNNVREVRRFLDVLEK